MQPAQRPHNGVNQVLNDLLLRDVPDVSDSATVGLHDLFGYLIERVFLRCDVVETDGVSVLRETQGDGFPEALGSTSDDSDAGGRSVSHDGGKKQDGSVKK